MIEVLENNIIPGNNSNIIMMFDLDDTLVVTDAKIRVLNKEGEEIKSLTPAEFNKFQMRPTYVLSFEDFEDPDILRSGELIHKMFKYLRGFYHKNIPVAIITARSNSKMVRNFFLDLGIDIHPDLCVAVNDRKYGYTGSIENRKQQAILDIVDRGFKYVTFFDDHAKNLKAAKDIERLRKDVTVNTIKV